MQWYDRRWSYELALACDEIFLVDDRSSAVSLPEVPLLGVLPGLAASLRWSINAKSVGTSPTTFVQARKVCVVGARKNGGLSTTSLHPTDLRKFRRGRKRWLLAATVPDANSADAAEAYGG